MVYAGTFSAPELASNLLQAPTSITLFIAPLVLTLLGMLIEPLANYADRYILKHLLGWATKTKSEARDKEEELLKNEIRHRHLGDLNGKIDNPFQLCKDYVEYKQLSTTFMAFLARYGFYRNCAFISLTAGIAAVTLSTTWSGAIASASISLLAVVIFRKRAEEFYSYQAPAIYRAFLIDKITWNTRDKDGVAN